MMLCLALNSQLHTLVLNLNPSFCVHLHVNNKDVHRKLCVHACAHYLALTCGTSEDVFSELRVHALLRVTFHLCDPHKN